MRPISSAPANPPAGSAISGSTAIPAIGRSDNGKIRQIELDSHFGKTRIFVTDGHLPYPFGHERTGYGVDDLSATLAKATASGAQVLWHSTAAERRASALVRFPGGYIAEIHQTAK